MEHRKCSAMGTEVELAVSHTAVTVERSLDEVHRLLAETENLVLRLEQSLSQFIERNELYQLNQVIYENPVL